MSSPQSFAADVRRLRLRGCDELADAVTGLCAFARSISGVCETWNDKDQRWLFKVELTKGAFISLKVQAQKKNVEMSLRGWPSDFRSDKLSVKPKMGGGSYSACRIESASQLRIATEYVQTALYNFRRGRRPRR
jgi:hypothetical protein